MLIITRHAPLVQYMIEAGIATPADRVITHATPADVRGQDVIGVLPLHLAALARTVTEVPLALTPADRQVMTSGDLTLERMREIAGEPVTYTVATVTRGSGSKPRTDGR